MVLVLSGERCCPEVTGTNVLGRANCIDSCLHRNIRSRLASSSSSLRFLARGSRRHSGWVRDAVRLAGWCTGSTFRQRIWSNSSVGCECVRGRTLVAQSDGSVLGRRCSRTQNAPGLPGLSTTIAISGVRRSWRVRAPVLLSSSQPGGCARRAFVRPRAAYAPLYGLALRTCRHDRARRWGPLRRQKTGPALRPPAVCLFSFRTP